jgi:Family of unknown function (DUF6502)
MPQSVKENLLAAFGYLLKPLARLAVRNDVSFPEFSEALKQAYVDAAAKQMKASGINPTDEGISLIANIQTTEVSDILHSNASTRFNEAIQEANPVAKALGAWHTDQKYLGPYGVLRDLQFSTTPVYSGVVAADRSENFTDLVNKYCPGVSPQALLDELIRSRCVQDVGNGFYRAIKRSYVPDRLSPASIALFARIVHNLCEAAEVNLHAATEKGKGLVERIIFTEHGITKQDLKAFDGFIRARGQEFADDIDNWLTERDKPGRTDTVNTGVGFYHYIVNEDDDLALSKLLPT